MPYLHCWNCCCCSGCCCFCWCSCLSWCFIVVVIIIANVFLLISETSATKEVISLYTGAPIFRMVNAPEIIYLERTNAACLYPKL